MLGISLLQYAHRQAQAAWSDLSMEQLLEEFQRIQQFVLLYPRQGEKGSPRAAYVLSKQTWVQLTGFSQDTEAGRAANYPPWVIPTGRLNLHKKGLLGISRPRQQ
jgi:hypothetical protein